MQVAVQSASHPSENLERSSYQKKAINAPWIIPIFLLTSYTTSNVAFANFRHFTVYA